MAYLNNSNQSEKDLSALYNSLLTTIGCPKTTPILGVYQIIRIYQNGTYNNAYCKWHPFFQSDFEPQFYVTINLNALFYRVANRPINIIKEKIMKLEGMTIQVENVFMANINSSNDKCPQLTWNLYNRADLAYTSVHPAHTLDRSNYYQFHAEKNLENYEIQFICVDDKTLLDLNHTSTLDFILNGMLEGTIDIASDIVFTRDMMTEEMDELEYENIMKSQEYEDIDYPEQDDSDIPDDEFELPSKENS